MEFVDKFMENVNLVGGGIAALFTLIFGPMWFLFTGLIILNVVDWLTGWRVARAKNEESSCIGAKGVLKKVGYWIVIGISFYISFSFEAMGKMIDVNLSFVNLLGWFVLANYVVNEIRSILENLLKLNVKLPAFLIKGLQIAGELIDNTADGSIPDIQKKQ